MKIYFTTILCIFITSSNLNGQSLFESGEIFDKIEGIINSMPQAGVDNYIEPTSAEMTDWISMLEDLWQGEISTVTTAAALLNYDLIEYTDNDGTVYYILQSMEINGNYWGTYVFNPNSCQTNLIIQSPHPKHDTNTGLQGIHIFETVGASFFMLAGTHRCNSITFSSCNGTTGSCGTPDEAYRISDMAHNTTSIFQASHELIYDINPDPYVIQLHGFGNLPDTPIFILSNTSTISPAVDKLSDFGAELISVEPNWTYGVVHIDPTLPLKGRTNTQGRYTNNSPDPCLMFATSNIGRFFHVEQKFTVRENIDGWDKVATAVDNLFNNMMIEDLVLDTGYYHAQDTLVCSAMVSSNSDLEITAGDCIEMSQGFEVIVGGEITIGIEECGN